MSPQKIQANKELFLKICRQEIERDGLDVFLNYLENRTDFFTAPSSASYHLNEEGGLCQHSLNVYEAALVINENLVVPTITSNRSAFKQQLSHESIAVAALFHDICKTKIYHKVEKWKKDDRGKWMSYPGYEIKDEFPFGHGEKSCLILHWFMHLKQDELLAIRWHMGMFDMGDAGSSSRFSYRAAMERSPLVALLQCADMLAANCVEETTKWK